MEIIEKKRGRRAIDINDRATAKNITLYDNHYVIMEKRKISVSEFSKWLLRNSITEYNNSEKKSISEGNSEPTSVSLYSEDYELIKEISNFSNFIRWGLENKIEKYLVR